MPVFLAAFVGKLWTALALMIRAFLAVFLAAFVGELWTALALTMRAFVAVTGFRPAMLMVFVAGFLIVLIMMAFLADRHFQTFHEMAWHSHL